MFQDTNLFVEHFRESVDLQSSIDLKYIVFDILNNLYLSLDEAFWSHCINIERRLVYNHLEKVIVDITRE